MSTDQPGMTGMPPEQPGMSAMPTDQFGVEQPWQQPPPKKGMSCGCMVLIFLGIVCVLLALLCCGGVVWMASYFGNAISDDPSVVAKVTERIAQLDVPEGLEPTVSFDMKIPFTGEPVMVWVVYVDEAKQSMLVLGSFGDALTGAGQNQEDVWEQIQKSLQQQGVQQEHNVRHWERSEKEIVVRGEPVTFYFATGTDEDSETQRIEVTGTFEGENGQVMFTFFGDAEKYDEPTIVETLESIR